MVLKVVIKNNGLSVVIVERHYFYQKIVVLKTLQLSSFCAIIFIQLESSNTRLCISISIW